MKRVLLVAGVLFISVISTACINNLAVQELNTKAKSFIEEGEYQSAVERLKSSLDLDPSVYESYYNLAVAYTKLEDYVNAFDNYKHALELRNDFADGYYSLAVCEENLIIDIEEGSVILDEDGKLSKPEDDIDDKKSLTDAEVAYVEELRADAIANYEKYLSLNAEASDKADVEARISELKVKVSE